jgi:hypothetical protein
MLSDKINIFPIIRADHPSIKSFDEQNTVISINKQGNILSFEHSRRNSGAAINVDRPEVSTGLHGKPIAYNLKNPSEEPETRRAELAAMARSAEARAREAEEKCEQAESILERELKERLLAEQRLRDLEEGRLRHPTAPSIEAPPVYMAAVPPHEDARTWLKEAEGRSKEAEIEIETLKLALKESEQRKAKAETLAQAAGDKARQLESEVGAARIALVEANRRMAGAEAAARAAEEKVHTIESRLIEAEAAGHQAIMERYQTIEAELQREVNQRAMAEQKLKEFEDELSSYLELDWSEGEPDMALVAVARDGGGSNEFASRLQAQVEAERRARQIAEDARAALELKMWEMERALRIAEENNRQIASLNLAKSADDDQTYIVRKRKGFKYELRFIFYGVALTLLLVTLCALIGTIYFQV